MPEHSVTCPQKFSFVWEYFVMCPGTIVILLLEIVIFYQELWFVTKYFVTYWHSSFAWRDVFSCTLNILLLVLRNCNFVSRIAIHPRVQVRHHSLEGMLYLHPCTHLDILLLVFKNCRLLYNIFSLILGQFSFTWEDILLLIFRNSHLSQNILLLVLKN